MRLFDVSANVYRNRRNCGVSVNNYGYKFINFLKLNYLYILNDRTSGNITGIATRKSRSTIDYFICNSALFDDVVSLNVLDFCLLLSDVHNRIELRLKFKTDKIAVSKENEEAHVSIWDRTTSDEFMKKFNLYKVRILEEKLDNRS